TRRETAAARSSQRGDGAYTGKGVTVGRFNACEHRRARSGVRAHIWWRRRNWRDRRYSELLLPRISVSDGHDHPAQLGLETAGSGQRDHEIHDHPHRDDRKRAGRTVERLRRSRTDGAAGAAVDAAAGASDSVSESNAYRSHAIRVSTLDEKTTNECHIGHARGIVWCRRRARPGSANTSTS